MISFADKPPAADIDDAVCNIEDITRSLPQKMEAGPDVAFGIGDQFGAAWEQLMVRMDSAFAALRKAILSYAWVDSTDNGVPSATTVVGYTGDFSTLWRADVTEATGSAHLISVEAALRSRAKLIRLAIAAAAAASAICTAVAAPVSALAALNAGWKLVTELRSVLTDVGTEEHTERCS